MGCGWEERQETPTRASARARTAYFMLDCIRFGVLVMTSGEKAVILPIQRGLSDLNNKHSFCK